MPYYLLQDFAAGLDLRKISVAAKPGSLRTLTNAYINAGGEVCKRYKLTLISANVSGGTATYGLHHHEGALYVFGTASSATGLPAWCIYQRLELDTPGPTITKILKSETFSDKIYVVARFSDDTVHHFYDGTEVTDQSPDGPGALAHQTKLFTFKDRNLRTSAVGRPDVYDPANTAGPSSANIPGASLIDMQQEDGSGGELMGLTPYYSYIAVFGRTAILIYAFDPDPDLTQRIQVLGSTGLKAHNAAAPYANGDVLYLAPTGIRSIRARDSSNTAEQNDIGSPIDDLIRARFIADYTSPEDAIYATSDPLTGHFWLVWGTTVYVLSYYPASKVSAWSTYEFDVSVDYITQGASRLFIRSGNAVYIYGAIAVGQDPLDPNAVLSAQIDWYDDCEVTVETPFLDMDTPATQKQWQALDVAAEGVWTVCGAPDPLNPTVWKELGRSTGPTYSRGQWRIVMQSTHLALQLKSTSRNAKLSAIAVHYGQEKAG